MQAKHKLPEFSEQGVLPPGVHYTRLDEFKMKFGFNSYRQEMIEQGFLPALKELRDKNVRFMFVNGSFVTKKLFPADIDAYVLVPHRSHPLFRFIAERHKAWPTPYRVHCFPAIQDEHGFRSEEQWKAFFGHQRDESAKAIVAPETFGG